MSPEASSQSSLAIARPKPVTLALGLLALLVVSNITGPLMPSSHGEIGFGIVSALIAAVAAWGLSRLTRWGYILTIVVAVLNVLLAAPAVAVGETALIKGAAGVTILVCLAVLILVTRPESRAACRSRR